MNETNWVRVKDVVTEKDIEALAKAKELQEERTKAGWLPFKINSRTTVFVPCDKDGNPTKAGKKILEQHKKLC